MLKINKENIYNSAGFFLLPLLWYVIADVFSLISPILVPPIVSVITRLFNLISNGSIFEDFFATICRWMSGFSLGVMTGVIAGLVLGMSPNLRKLFEFPLEFLRSMPVTAIFPLFLIIFGIGDSSKVAMAFVPTFLLMTVNTTYGVTLSDSTRRRMATIFGAGRLQVFRYVVIMDALPQIFIGLRLSLAQSLIVTVVSEMFIGTDFGLGQRVYDSYLTNSVTTLYSLLIVLGLVGYIVNKLLVMIESRFLFWTGK